MMSKYGKNKKLAREPLGEYDTKVNIYCFLTGCLEFNSSIISDSLHAYHFSFSVTL